ncbi:hypothetical protein KM914_14375 [Virgibacillus pantothenticus]|uniref:hypothetical protein n=1 Tax=Virgibacillus pantothenticus TaxID=1473 RepID=UPI000956C913|nr:hypothetical protein [Virgibacillus pantothenticus]MBU8567606.1 hypothetical protein [Virgibacillus pantothenticus]MBU8601394.1 hypothetical protein [Virgibacillus pantothenticus]MBU8636211.1 hypothetical protein [Virgibacillus pantothenticus]MBU8643731.1 hypothetical protein [Virgibacillus pantothenticus]MBU8648013.1 hypothetical protein [Virgibacillus pantothenticus]
MQKPEGLTYRKNAIYAVYKGESMLAMGTAKERAEDLEEIAEELSGVVEVLIVELKDI